MRRILFALDPTLAVIEEARAWGADLLVTHHPLLLRGRALGGDDERQGRLGDARSCARACALYVAHTNADVADPGVSTVSPTPSGSRRSAR